MRLLVNASNLHVGGGVAVAGSVVDSISRLPQGADVGVLVSSEVAENLKVLETDTAQFAHFQVADAPRGLRSLTWTPPLAPRDFDATFNVFGPVYCPALARGSIMGFAQPWIAFPRSAARRRKSGVARVKSDLSFFVQSLFFRLARCLVVEQEVVRRALMSNRILRGMEIDVVGNVVDEIFLRPDDWEAVIFPDRHCALRLGIVASAYPHKNLSVLPQVRSILRDRYGIDSEFWVTLPEASWQAQSEEFQQALNNMGPLNLAQSASFTSQLDAVVFPTLLECFSATPLEARALGVPIFASDLSVIRETVADYPVYFDPESPADIAAKIAAWYPNLRDASRPGAPAPATIRGDAEARAMALLGVCGMVDSDEHAARPRSSSVGAAAEGGS